MAARHRGRDWHADGTPGQWPCAASIGRQTPLLYPSRGPGRSLTIVTQTQARFSPAFDDVGVRFRTRGPRSMLGGKRRCLGRRGDVVRPSTVNSERRRKRGALRKLNVRAWSVATKIVGLCVGVAAAGAVGLTTLGYTQAASGLKQQAEAALWSDGLVVANQVDAWNDKRLRSEEHTSELQSHSFISYAVF